MNIIIIKLVFLVFVIYPHLRLLKQLLLDVSVQFMLDNEIIWDKRIDKPRLLSFIIFDGIFLFFWLSIEHCPFTTNYYGVLAYQVLLCACMLLCVFMLFYSWTNHFANSILPATKELAIKSCTKEYSSILSKDVDIKSLYDLLNGKYIDCELDTFISHIKPIQFGEKTKIYWIHVNTTNHNNINKQTLLELIVRLYPSVYSNEGAGYSLVGINQIITNSYRRLDGGPIKISSSNLQQWKDSRSKPLIEFRKILDQCLSLKQIY